MDPLRPVPGFERCLAREDGTIFLTLLRNGSIRELHAHNDRGRTPYVSISRLGALRPRRVHVAKLICLAFHGDPPAEDWYPRHADGDPHNCAACNLRWGAPEEWKTERALHQKGPRPGAHVPKGRALSPEDVHQIRAHIHAGSSQRSIAKHYCCSRSAVSSIGSGTLWGKLPNPPDGLPAVERLPDRPRARRGYGAETSPETVHQVRAFLAAGWSTTGAAQRIGVSRDVIRKIAIGETWTTVSNPSVGLPVVAELPSRKNRLDGRASRWKKKAPVIPEPVVTPVEAASSSTAPLSSVGCPSESPLEPQSVTVCISKMKGGQEELKQLEDILQNRALSEEEWTTLFQLRKRLNPIKYAATFQRRLGRLVRFLGVVGV